MMPLLFLLTRRSQGDGRKLIVHCWCGTLDIFWDDQGTSVPNPLSQDINNKTSEIETYLWQKPACGEMGGDSVAGGVHHVLCRALLVTVPSPRGQPHQECDSIHRDLAHRTGDISPTQWRVTHCNLHGCF